MARTSDDLKEKKNSISQSILDRNYMSMGLVRVIAEMPGLDDSKSVDYFGREYLIEPTKNEHNKDANNDGLYIRIKTSGTVVEREIDTSAVG